MTTVRPILARRRSAPSLASQPQGFGQAIVERGRLTPPIQTMSVLMKPDWILVALPTALSLKTLYSGASPSRQLVIIGLFVTVNGILVARAFLRSAEFKYATKFGPLVLLLISAAIAVSRPSEFYQVAILVAVALLVMRIVQTVDGRRIIASITDGIGLYLILNVLLYYLGMRSPSAAARVALTGGETDRIVFPLAHSVNLPPALAAAYLGGVLFLVAGPWSFAKFFRLACVGAAMLILVGGGSRQAAVAAVSLPAIAILAPRLRRFLGPLTVVIAAASALVLPAIVRWSQSFLTPLLSVVSSRTDMRPIYSMNGRDIIWSRALSFWNDQVQGALNILFGFGMDGQYRSGASLSYYRLFVRTSLFDPAMASVHNSFLAQLFSAGVVGLVMFAVALFWTSLRLSRRLASWHNYASAAIVLFCALLLGAMTESFLIPDVNHITFWVLVVLVGAACQCDPAEDGAPDMAR